MVSKKIDKYCNKFNKNIEIVKFSDLGPTIHVGVKFWITFLQFALYFLINVTSLPYILLEKRSLSHLKWLLTSNPWSRKWLNFLQCKTKLLGDIFTCHMGHCFLCLSDLFEHNCDSLSRTFIFFTCHVFRIRNFLSKLPNSEDMTCEKNILIYRLPYMCSEWSKTHGKQCPIWHVKKSPSNFVLVWYGMTPLY